MHLNTLPAWLDWLESQKSTSASAKTLADTQLIAEKLNLVSYPFRVITVGGTNGKGSCVALLESIYSRAGYGVGAFTSPHLLQFNERICVREKQVTDDEIVEAFNKISAACGNISLNYFQFTLLAALLIFQSAQIEVAILEVGIGGRLDPTNILDADLSIIASIDLDHCELLGNTREMITLEKAGIMRKNQPTICGDFFPPGTLFQEAKRIGAKLYCIERDFFCRNESAGWVFESKTQKLLQLPRPTILLSNAAVVLMAVECLSGILPVSAEETVQGLKKVNILGRCQEALVDGVKVVLDVAHNPASAKMLLEKLKSLKLSGECFAVVGMMKDKDIANTLKCLYGNINRWFVSGLPGARGAGEEILANALEKIGEKRVECCVSVEAAFQQALKQARPGDGLIVFGSFLTVSIVMLSIADRMGSV